MAYTAMLRARITMVPSPSTQIFCSDSSRMSTDMCCRHQEAHVFALAVVSISLILLCFDEVGTIRTGGAAVLVCLLLVLS